MAVVARAKGHSVSVVRTSPPPGCEEVVVAFLDLHRTRSHTGFGGSLAISMREIESWCRLNRVEFTGWELEALLALDAAALEVKAEQDKQATNRR
jgi:molybdenum cofactor biosynthesis enzyme